MRLIDADILADEIESMKISVSGRPATFDEAKSDVMQVINEQKTVYAAELLRDQWISVEDRLPELIPCSAGTAYSEAVVVLTSGKKAMIAIWDGVDFICAADYWDAEGEQITHWMALPELPEVDKA